jgi:molecular chaperone DnaK
VVLDGVPLVLADFEGHRLQPSVVLARLDGSRAVGRVAVEAFHGQPGRVIRVSKRLMGRRFASSEVLRFREVSAVQVVEGDHGEPLFRIDGRLYELPEVAGLILKRMKEVAEQALSKEVDRAVITVPAYFTDRQRYETRRAAEMAGLVCLRILNEPTAAALAYGAAKTVPQNLVVYDLGGGTFDVSVLKVGDGVCEVISTDGDTYLGGEDFDRLIAEVLFADLRATNTPMVEDARACRLLQTASEELKKGLSRAFNASQVVEGLGLGPNDETYSVSVSLDRRRYAHVVQPLVQRTFQVCDEALRAAKLTVSQIDEVLLVGGMTHDFAIQKGVEDYFGRLPRSEHNPEEVVALGAAVQAWTLTEIIDAEKATLLLDVTSRSLGVETRGGFIDIVVPRNTKIPTSASKVFHTVHENQRQVRISIFQGEGHRREHNEFMGAFVLDGIPEATAGEVAVRVLFELDADGIVHISAEDLAGGGRNSMELKLKRLDGR